MFVSVELEAVKFRDNEADINPFGFNIQTHEQINPRCYSL